MINVERTMSLHGFRPGMAAEARSFLEEIARARLPEPEGSVWSVDRLIESLTAAGVLRSTPAPDHEPKTR